ncbi:MAG TPA: 4-hydroxy-tetrahydrodipicolinate synthase [Myxococcota bacterium]|nr:4-hydroxy-tetrahydrodipicolinate synthase [Myxococcota bacterium]
MTQANQTLRGVLTALVTPMNQNGSIDWAALDALVDRQLAAGIDGLVPCGTTGESATLTPEERDGVIDRVVRRVAGRVPVVAGTGSNSTAATVENQRRAQTLGASHGLVVTPFYNKPTSEGLYRHYATVAEGADLPVVIYNVPGRTACDIKPETVAQLAKLPGIVGIKEATADLDRVTALRAGIATRFALLSGDDGTTCAFTLMGGDGVISVASNVVPEEMRAMVHAALEGRVEAARDGHARLRNLIHALFLESNPIPVKAAMAMRDGLQEAYRLPLCPMTAGARTALQGVLRAGGWI